ncbi:protein of unknown function DUF785 [Methanosalsum zhilinae DSM 4017]|uniref:Retropepsin-like aspartic endopeptidase domain-containing protein n=1 Tax=Methanosalsum zhilinae (strain DSM 4017 / NBRC 107636 / OCM 62 / WeN5) TaxID=679901 RepID=F7XP60_METZD|nr:RimK/LysX family protein [Methanosalsum zhilinae]AEH61352.1 protein of unknown function DUF785 [Methanosalsum zhilinae DSM 4017]
MEMDDLRNIFLYSEREKRVLESFDIDTSYFIPFLFSLKNGGSWSYSTDTASSVSVKKVTTVYDDKRKEGYTEEEIYLFIDPEICKREGSVTRLEKCGRKDQRVAVKRPYHIEVTASRVFLATVNPYNKKIIIRELMQNTVQFTGSPAYNMDHEMEHILQKGIKGIELWNFDFVTEK